MVTNEKPSFVDYLVVIFKKRTFVYKIVLIGAAVSAIISVCLPNQYTATTTILPPNPQQDIMYGLANPNLVSSFGGFTGLTSLLAGGTSPSDLFAAILSSGRITGTIVQKYNLQRVFRSRTHTDAVKQLEEITRIGVSPEGMITVSVTWYDKYLATDIANSYIDELDKFNKETAMTTGKKYRIFIEKRLKENIDTLKQAEEALKTFQEKHRTIVLDVELENAIKAIAELKSQIILLEVQKGAMSSASQNENPYLSEINNQLRELKRQLSKIEFGDATNREKEFGAGFGVPFAQLPEVALEYARCVRDVTVQSVIYELLTQQYEQAKIMEAKDTPTVQVLDRASPPEKKSYPKRTRIVVLVSIFCLILGILGTFALESFQQAMTRPNDYTKWRDIYQKARSDAKAVKTALVKIVRGKRKS